MEGKLTEDAFVDLIIRMNKAFIIFWKAILREINVWKLIIAVE